MFDWFLSLFKSGAPDVEIIDRIELNVSLLELKLTTSNEKINECVQRQIFGVLQNYANLVAKIPKKVKSKQYKYALQQSIETVQEKLNCVPTTRSGGRGQTLTNNAAVQKAKSYISEIVERMKSDQIAEIDYSSVLEKLTFHVQSLEVSGIKLVKEVQENLCIVFLELFLRIPSVKSVSEADTRNIDVRTLNNQPVSQDFRINVNDNKRANWPGVHGKNSKMSSLSKDELTVNSNSFNNYGHWEKFYFEKESTAAAIPETSNSYNRCEILIPEEMATSSKAFDNKPQNDTIIGGILSGTVSDENSSNTCQRFYFGNQGKRNTGNFNTHHQLQPVTSEEKTSSKTQGNEISNERGTRNALLSNLQKQNDNKTYKMEVTSDLSYAAILTGKIEKRTNPLPPDVKTQDMIERQNQSIMPTGGICKNDFQNTNVGKNFGKDKEKTGYEENKKSASTSLLDQDKGDKSGVNDILEGMENLNIEDKSNEIDTDRGTKSSSLLKPETSKMSQIDGAGKNCKYEEINEKSSQQRSAQNKMNDDKNKENFSNNSTNDLEFSEHHLKLLDQIKNELGQFENSVEQFKIPPFDPNQIFRIKENVTDVLNNKLKKIPQNDKTCHMKTSLHAKSMQILSKLSDLADKNRKCVEEALHMLNDMENEIYRSIDSNDDFCKKRETLESTADIMTAVAINVRVVNWKKTKIRNKIQTFLIAEAMKHMRELKEKLDRHKINAKNFAYPKKVDVYQNLTEEIGSLEKLLVDLPKGESCIDKRSQYLRSEIKEVLGILENKAKLNEEIFSLLQNLKDIEEQIETKKYLEKDLLALKHLNKIRGKIGEIGNYNQKLKTRKLEIFSHLHSTEEKLYSAICPEEICLKKRNLNKLELSFQDDESGLSKVQQYRDRLLSLKSDTEVITRKNTISDEIMTIFRYNIQLLFEILKKAKEESKYKDQCLRKFNENRIIGIVRSKSPTSYKIRQLEEFGRELKKIKETTNQMEILGSLENIERMITIEKSKLHLEEFNKCFESIRIIFYNSKHPFETYGFTKTINEIFDMKECVEDMPEGNPELDSSKQTFLKTTFNTLKTLDEKLAGLAMKEKKLENILELHHHFEDFNPDSSDIDKESVEFVAIIRKKAETFEEQVKYYTGTSYSKEYYVIYEKLMLLLEELDELCCEDLAVENATVECMSYIKGLIKQLNTNASSE